MLGNDLSNQQIERLDEVTMKNDIAVSYKWMKWIGVVQVYMAFLFLNLLNIEDRAIDYREGRPGNNFLFLIGFILHSIGGTCNLVGYFSKEQNYQVYGVSGICYGVLNMGNMIICLINFVYTSVALKIKLFMFVCLIIDVLSYYGTIIHATKLYHLFQLHAKRSTAVRGILNQRP